MQKFSFNLENKILSYKAYFILIYEQFPLKTI